MKYTFLIIIAILAASSLRAQNSVQISRKDFQIAVQAELAKHEGGEYLYQHADAYKRLVDYTVRKQLGLLKETKERSPALIMSIDTSHSFDASNDPEDQDETTVGINRVDKTLICIGANDIGMFTLGMPVYTSTDEGASWGTYRLPQPVTGGFVASGDPIIATDDQGNFYYAYLGGDGTDLRGNICVATSSDGINWHNGKSITINTVNAGYPDKEHMTVDCSPGSPHYGRVYMVWYEFYTNTTAGEGLNVLWSDDKCKTWTSKPTFLGTSDNFQEIKINSHGDVLLTTTDSYTTGQEIFVSTDGGKTFIKRKIPVTNGVTLYPHNKEGRNALKGPLGFRSFSYVTFDIDLSSNRIHAVYPNYEQAPERMASVLYYTTSDNNGANWSVPKLLGLSNPDHSSPGFDRFHPWVTFDQKTGEAYALYYSSEQDPDNLLTAAYRVKLSDNLRDYPEMLHSNFDPTIVEATPQNLAFIGDYNGSDAFDSVYVGTWTENRPDFTDGEVFAYISHPKSPENSNAVSNTIVVHSDKPWISTPYPNPVTGRSISASYYVPHSTHISFELFDASGKKILLLSDKSVEEGSYTEDFSLGSIPAGTYFLRMITSTWEESRKFIVSERQ